MNRSDAVRSPPPYCLGSAMPSHPRAASWREKPGSRGDAMPSPGVNVPLGSSAARNSRTSAWSSSSASVNGVCWKRSRERTLAHSPHIRQQNRESSASAAGAPETPAPARQRSPSPHVGYVVTGMRFIGRGAAGLAPALAAVALVQPSSALADGPWNAGPATYGVSNPVQHMVTMSDGVQLAVDVYVPTQANGNQASGPFPVIMSQTPYNKRSPVTTQSMGPGFGGDGFYPYLVQRGYIDVVADVRGTGESGGDFSLFGPREMQDGVELARWASRLSGSDHRVGLAGSSYLGLNQIFTAALAGRRSPIKAISPSTVGNDLYRDLAFGGGIPDTEFALVWEGLRASMTADVPSDAQSNPQTPVSNAAGRLVNLADQDAQLYAEVDTGGPRAFANDYWDSRAPSNYLDRVARNGVPALLLSGWHDVYQRGAVLHHTRLQDADSRPPRHSGRPAGRVPPMKAGTTPRP